MTERIPALKREMPLPRTRRGRNLLRLVIAMFIIVLVVLFFRSSLSKVSEIEITGIRYLGQDEVAQALGVSVGDSFFFSSVSQLESRVYELNPVKEVRIIKKFPGVVQVEVTEFPQVAVKLTANGKLFAVLSNGLELPIPEGGVVDKPILSDWQSMDEQLTALCLVLEQLPSYLLADLSEIQPDPSLAYPSRIRLFTRSRFEVVTTIEKLAEKIPYLSDLVQNREPGKIIMLEADTYTPYSVEFSNE